MVFSKQHFISITINHQKPTMQFPSTDMMQLTLTLKTATLQKRQSLSKTVLSRTTLIRTITRQTFHSFTIFCVVTDIDECTANAHDCHLDATCSNTDGSFTCSCNQGYSGDGKQCGGMFVISASKKPKDSMLTGVSGEGGSWVAEWWLPSE